MTRLWTRTLASGLAACGLAAAALPADAAERRCLTECTPRIGIVSAFGAEADLLLAETRGARTHRLRGQRYTTGVLRGHPVVIVLSGVSMINAAMTTQTLIDHFRIERLVMSGIAGGIDPAYRVGDVVVPDRWAMPMEVYWSHDAALPSPCGPGGEMGCLGLALARDDAGKPYPPFGTMFLRGNHLLSAKTAPAGEFRFDYPVDPEMLAVARTLAPKLERCGPKARGRDGRVDDKLCVAETPQLRVGGRGVSGTAFLANPGYRDYLFETLQARTVEMETAALAHVAHANGIPYIAFRSLSDLAGAHAFNADVVALFASGLAEHNEAAVTLAFLEAWKPPRQRARTAAK